ncbi:hypothetical protein TNCV_2084851 [Trichonephila clavipes]|uniref:Uncharacterized protein n=1 Tax=Trichonephila clavipes TaxID=2585209 RepID=A0A8X6RKL2_TRICX|nr:hypothetical protein TNCV_2084851 [Trichonephila clavipes]
MIWIRGVTKRMRGYRAPGRIEEAYTYANFLLLSELLLGVPATEHQNVWFTHDGAPAHFFIAVRNHFHTTYPERWTEYGRSFTQPLRYPDLNPLDFFFGVS